MRPVVNDAHLGLASNQKLILTLCNAFDQGEEILALPLATALRVLLHDTPKSTSLLQMVGLKKGKLFLSTNRKAPDEPVHCGLVRSINVGVHDGRRGEAKYWALCDERYFPSPGIQVGKLSFNEWWEETVFRNSNHSLSRKDLVLAVTNKDGGAHFDQQVETKYDQFRQTWSGGSSLVGLHSGEYRGYDNVPTLPAIRQIAYEVLMSKVHDANAKSS